MSAAEDLDLVLERVVDVPRAKVWAAWTTPALLMPWFCPVPWKVVECDIDLRPGGRFRTVMQSPEGERFPGEGCYLEVVPGERLVWTSALLPGYRPAPEVPMMPLFTGVITLADVSGGTRYVARVMHRNAADAKAHADMGFHQGWGIALDQLVAMIKAG